MKIDANAALHFIGRYLAIGTCVYFGWQIGGWADHFIPNLPS